MDADGDDFHALADLVDRWPRGRDADVAVVRILAEGIGRARRRERHARVLGEAHNLRALAAGHFTDAIAEVTVGQQREFLPRLGEVGHRRLHTRASGPGDRDVEFVFGRIGVATIPFLTENACHLG